MLAILYPNTVWRRFGSWLRTVRPGVAPSEQVVALALRESLREFIAGFRKTNPLAKIISENIDVDRVENFRLPPEENSPLLRREIRANLCDVCSHRRDAKRRQKRRRVMDWSRAGA